MSSDISRVIIAVVTDLVKDDLLDALLNEGFHVTEVGSTSNLFTTGFSSLLVGVAETQVPQVVQIIREKSETSFDPGEKRAVVYVLKVSDFVTLHPQGEAAL